MPYSHIFKKKNKKTQVAGKKPIANSNPKAVAKRKAQTTSRKKVQKFDQNQKIPDFGSFQESIVKTLKDSRKPIKVEQIARKTKKSKEFVFIWLCSIGKSIKSVKKVDFGVYTYDSTIDSKTDSKTDSNPSSESESLETQKAENLVKPKAKTKKIA